MKLTVPTIHRNGTSRDALLQEHLDAAHAVRAAIDALASAAPNARDYYPQGDDAFRKADAEHLLRLAKLQSVYDELNALVEEIAG